MLRGKARDKYAVTDSQIAQLWADHYPHRRYDPWSRTICELIRVIVNETARGQDLSTVRAELEITQEQWNEF